MIFCEMVTWTVRDGADGDTLLFFNCMSVHFSTKPASHHNCPELFLVLKVNTQVVSFVVIRTNA